MPENVFLSISHLFDEVTLFQVFMTPTGHMLEMWSV